MVSPEVVDLFVQVITLLGGGGVVVGGQKLWQMKQGPANTNGKGPISKDEVKLTIMTHEKNCQDKVNKSFKVLNDNQIIMNSDIGHIKQSVESILGKL